MTSFDHDSLNGKVALVTGAAHRIGAMIARALHAQNMNLVLHYRNSEAAARCLQAELHSIRADSVALLQADLLDTPTLPTLIDKAQGLWQRLDVLVNNASGFYPTPFGNVTETQWDDLMGSNLKAPFFLAQAAAPYLAQHHGCIVNIADIHADRPLKAYPVYSIAKAGLVMLTKALARELGPEVRVNAVAPGAILWPEHNIEAPAKEYIISRTALKRAGVPYDIAQAVLFLIRDAGYISGHVLTVDGGRSLSN